MTGSAGERLDALLRASDAAPESAQQIANAPPDAATLEPIEAFKRFYQESRQKDAPDAILKAFEELHNEVSSPGILE